MSARCSEDTRGEEGNKERGKKTRRYRLRMEDTTKKGESGESKNAERKKKHEGQRDERLIWGGSGVWEDLLSSLLFTGSSFKSSTDGCIHRKAFYCIFPSLINSLYLHLCVGKRDCCCLAHGFVSSRGFIKPDCTSAAGWLPTVVLLCTRVRGHLALGCRGRACLCS